MDRTNHQVYETVHREIVLAFITHSFKIALQPEITKKDTIAMHWSFVLEMPALGLSVLKRFFALS